MNTQKDIREVAQWLNDWRDKGHTVVLEPELSDHVLSRVDLDVVLKLGYKLVTRATQRFLEIPEHSISKSTVDAIVMMCAADLEGKTIKL